MKKEIRKGTPTPWKTSPWRDSEGLHIDIVGRNEVETVATLTEGPLEQNAEAILRGVNSYGANKKRIAALEAVADAAEHLLGAHPGDEQTRAVKRLQKALSEATHIALAEGGHDET